MAGKTYAQLATSADVQDADLIATYRATGPLKTVTGDILKGYCQTFDDEPLLVSTSVAAPVSPTDYIQLKPSDYAAGKPGLFVTKSSTAGIWTLSVTDGSTLGELDFSVSLLKVGAPLTVTGLTTTAASATSGAGLNLPAGTAPISPNNGDVWTTSAGLFFRTAGVTTQAGQQPFFLHVRYTTAAGAASAETLTASTWNPRLLNTAVVNTIAGASLASNQISLPAGTYEVAYAHSPIKVSSNLILSVQHRLRNVTDSATALLGVHYTSDAIQGLPVSIPMQGQITLAGTKTLQIELWVSFNGDAATSTNFNAGGENNIYSDLYIRRVA